MKHYYVMFQINEISNECLETGTSSSKTNFQDGVPHEEHLNFARKCVDKMGKSEVEKPPSSSKTKKEKLLSPTKVVIRRLPPSLTEDQLKEALGGLPEHDFFYFVGSDMSFGPMSFTRAYINFKNRDDIIKFRDHFDGYCFVDSRGVEYPTVVEYAPYQGIPKKKGKKDPKVGSILEDPDYLAFIETLNKANEPPPSIEAHLEEIEAKKSSSGTAKISTPLLEYLKMKKSSRGRPASSRGIPDKKQRPEREEVAKLQKKGSSSTSSSNKDSGAKSTTGQQPPKDEKPKDGRKDAKNREDNRRKDELDRKGTRDTKAAPTSRDKSDTKSSSKGKEEKGRPDSGRFGRRSDNRRSDERRPEDRRANNRRDRRDSTDSPGNDRGRDDRYRKESGSESGRRDRRPDSRRDSRPSREHESKPKDREPLPKASDSEKDVKPTKESEREQASATAKEKEKKDKESSAVTGDSKSPEEEVRGAGKDDKRRVRNKDRPDRPIYQPRSVGRGGPRTDNPKTAEANAEKDKSKDSKTKDKTREPERDARRTRDDKTRDRDRDRYRDDRRERDRDRERPRDKTRDREADSGRVRDSGPSKEDKGKGDSNGTQKTSE